MGCYSFAFRVSTSLFKERRPFASAVQVRKMARVVGPKNAPFGRRLRLHAAASIASSLTSKTLVCTRGPNFPLSRLETRVMCPTCGSRSVTVVFEPPSNAQVG
jgi:hypothetical protein